MQKRKQIKIIASMLIFMLTVTHLNVTIEVLATSLENQSIQTNNEKVEFDAYFLRENKKEHAATKTIGEENYLYTDISVKEAGYLTNAEVRVDNTNFKISESFTDENISKVESNKVNFNKINNGNTVTVAIPIQMLYQEKIALEQFNKQNIVKLTGTYVDGKGQEKHIEKEIIVSLAWTAKKEAELDVQISKVIPYRLGENSAIVLEMTVKSYLKDNTLPIKENKIEISTPEINKLKPEQVKVRANTLKAINGDETGNSFNKNNYKIDTETGNLIITVTNSENENGVSWKKDAYNEYVITYIYKEPVKSEGPTEGEIGDENTIDSFYKPGDDINISINKVISELTTYGAEETKITKSSDKGEVTLKEQIGNLVDFEVKTTTELSKGQIYANYQATNKKETEYEETITTNIGYSDITDNIILTQDIDRFAIENNLEKEATETYYKKITVNKEEFEKILGKDGSITLFTGTGDMERVITKIDAETLEVDLSYLNTNNLKMKTSKPQTEGKLNIKILKAIKSDVGYTKSDMIGFKYLDVYIAANAQYEGLNLVKQNLKNQITLTEPTSQAELVINNSNLSTLKTNENVKITAVLKTDTLNCRLYTNPVLQITLPNCIENINVKKVEALFDTEASKLTVKSYEVVQNVDGTKTILVNLEGIQTEYTLAAVSKGVNVVITSDITVNKFTANKQEQIKMVYTNNNVIGTTAETKKTALTINIVAPVGVITTSTMSNFNDTSETITSVSETQATGTIAILSEAKNANLLMEVINNYNNEINNISILGRTAFKGNRDILSKADLGTTIDMPLTSNITVNGVDGSKVKVYYSENGEATKDLSVASNGWTLTPTNLSNIKSYLIVLENHSMNKADRISFNYTMQIPANLQHNESAYENYVVYFNNNLETGTIEDKQASTKLGVTTGKGVVFDATMVSNVEEEQEITTGKFIKYTLNVKNTGEQIAENILANINLPRYATYIEYENGETGYYKEFADRKTLSYELGNIEPNEEKTISFWVKIENLQVEDICKDESHYEIYENTKYHKESIKHSDEEFNTTISIKADITKDGSKVSESNIANNKIVKSYFEIEGYTNTETDTILSEGDSLKYNYTVKLYDAGRNVENAIVTMNIPEGLKYESARIRSYNAEKQESEYITDGIEYDEKTRILTINLGATTSGAKGVIEINTIVDKLPENVYEKQISAIIKVKADGIEEEVSNELINKVAKEDVKIKQTSNIKDGETIVAGENYSYKFEIQNIGGKSAENLTFKTIIPEELRYENTIVQIEEKNGIYENVIYSISEDNVVEQSFTLEKGKKANITVNVIAKEITESKNISSIGIVYSDEISTKTSNEITHIIEAADYDNKPNSDKVEKRITGEVWKDENTNGVKDEDEMKIAGIEVMLFNNETGKLAIDENGQVLKTITNEKGIYTFSKIGLGKYTVIYLYDTASYSATTYRKEDIDDSINSDAVDTQIALNGVVRVAAITEEIVITDSNIYNIDLGLVSNPKFDLKIDKTVSKITVQDAKGTNVYEFNDSKLAKKELVAKQIEGTTIIVEYKIKVTNEGAISGFVKKIADYMPEEMKFSSELNKDWYTSGNGVLYNSSLANTIINPGESKVVKLTLTKKMTENNLGLYHNEAEIYEAYNDLGIKDIDSTEGNKLSNEDDISSADVLITVKTGEIILYTGLALTIIVIISIGIYFIRKKVLK